MGLIRRSTFTVALVVLLALTATGCYVNQPAEGLSVNDRLSPSATFASASRSSDIAYGEDPLQKLDVYRPPGASIGTVVYVHGGGFTGGDKAPVMPFVLNNVNRGWSVVSVNYRLAPGVRAPQQLADVSRAVRYVRANATALKVNPATIVLAGGSAGGTLAMLVGMRPGAYVDPAWPADVRAASDRVDGIVNLVGPSDMTTWGQVGSFVPGFIEAWLGCSLGARPNVPRCSASTLRTYSPRYWADWAAAAPGSMPIPPLYLGYGRQDWLVPVSTQGDPLYRALVAAVGDLKVYYDIPVQAGHGPDYDLNNTIFAYWLNKVQTQSW